MKTRQELIIELHSIHKDVADFDNCKTAADWDAMAQRIRACLSFATKAKATLARAESL